MLKPPSTSESRQIISRSSTRQRMGTEIFSPSKTALKRFQTAQTLSSSTCLSNFDSMTPHHDPPHGENPKITLNGLPVNRDTPESNYRQETNESLEKSTHLGALRGMKAAANHIIALTRMRPKMTEIQIIEEASDVVHVKNFRSMTPSHNLSKFAEKVVQKQKQAETLGSKLLSGASPKENGDDPDQPKTVKPKYSYVKQRVLFIPRDIDSLSMDKGCKTTFTSFDNLAKTTKSVHADMLENLLSKNIDLQNVDAPKIPKENRLNVIKDILKFNQLQKDYYIDQIKNKEQRSTSLSRGEGWLRKTKGSMPFIKITPSKKLLNNLYEFLESDEVNTNTNNSQEKINQNDKSSHDSDQEAVSNEFLSMSKVSNTNDIVVKNRANEKYKFFWHYSNPERGQWKPAARECHTLTAVGRVFVVYGGISNKLIDDIVIYDPIKDSWTVPELKGDVPLLGRHSHTACEYQNKVVFFGGSREFNPVTNARECLNDVYTFDPEKHEWKIIKPEVNSITCRRNHAATIHDKFMYVYAGIDAEGIYLSDLWAFNLKTHEWIQYHPHGDREQGQAFHTMCACFDDKAATNNSHHPHQTHQNHHLHHPVIHLHSKPKSYQEGFYVFGGRDSDGRVLGTLKYLSLDTEYLEWKYPSTKGVSPSPRYNHVMLFYEPLKLLLIHGGRNDDLSHLSSAFLDDIRVLNLETMTWGASCSIGNVPSMGRARHAAAFLGSTLAIFGGVSISEYANPDMKLIETNQLTVWKIAKEYGRRSLRRGTIVNHTHDLTIPLIGEQIHLLEKQALFKVERRESIKLEPLSTKHQPSPVNKKINLKSNIKDMIARNGFASAMKTLNKIEGERIKLKKLLA